MKKPHKLKLEWQKRNYLHIRIKDTHAHPTCLGYNLDGTSCKRKPRRGYFCDKCRKLRQQYNHYSEDDYGVCLTEVE